jgi:hypothetical protein
MQTIRMGLISGFGLFLGKAPQGETARQAKSELPLYRHPPAALQSARDLPRRAPSKVNFSLIDSVEFPRVYDICAMQRMSQKHGTHVLRGLLKYPIGLYCIAATIRNSTGNALDVGLL